MKISIREIRDRYVAMSDWELIDIYKNSDLTDVAAQAMKEELTKRGIDIDDFKDSQGVEATRESEGNRYVGAGHENKFFGAFKLIKAIFTPMEERMRPFFEDGVLFNAHKAIRPFFDVLKGTFDSLIENRTSQKSQICIGFFGLGIVNAIGDVKSFTPEEHLYFWRAVSKGFEISDEVSDKIHTYASCNCWDKGSAQEAINVQNQLQVDPLQELIDLGMKAYIGFVEGNASVPLGASLMVEEYFGNPDVPESVENI